MAKNLTLTAEQAAKFWPVFDAYQKEQNVIIDAQLKDIQKYVSNYETMDDAGALALMTPPERYRRWSMGCPSVRYLTYRCAPCASIIHWATGSRPC